MSEVTFEPFQRVLVRSTENQAWSTSFFSHEQHSEDGLEYVCGGQSWNYCIPYEGNEHLLGTTDSPTPSEPEFKFGDKVEVSDNNIDWHKAIYYAACKNKASNLIALNEDLGLLRWKYCRHADW